MIDLIRPTIGPKVPVVLDLKKLTQQKILLFDGAMGTMLQQRGLIPGELPELLNLSHPEKITDIHREYVQAGADIITTNTFQANELKLGKKHSVEPIISAAVHCAQASGSSYTALGIGPLGQLMEPMGTVTFQQAYDIFRRQMIAGVSAGADLILIETLSDPYEAKAAILAAKENTSLPVICSMTFQENGRTFVGCDPLTAIMILQGLGVDALGVNCSVGPESLKGVVDTLLKYSRLPIIVQANSGMPTVHKAQTLYNLSPQDYAAHIAEMIRKGVRIVGGCCGTTPEHIRELHQHIRTMTPTHPTPHISLPTSHFPTACTSGTQTVILDDTTTVIGERLNPTGKKKMQDALRQNDTTYLINEALVQLHAGAQILDINAGLPDIDEPSALVNLIRTVQNITTAPLQIDSADPAALEAALRLYNGKPIINSVNGKPDSMARIFPLVKKYGALVIGLTLDEHGTPPTAQGRLDIARHLRNTAISYGIAEENLLIDCLVLTASAQQAQVQETLKAIRLIKSELNLKTVLGISNVSFGLPNRDAINATFLAAALGAGLDAAIINPLSPRCREILDIYRVLNNEDQDAVAYISTYASTETAVGAVSAHTTLASTTPSHTAPQQSASNQKPPATNCQSSSLPLSQIIEQGRRDEAAEKVKILLQNTPPLDIIDQEFIPALNQAGKRFETGEIFLPQLMMSAQAAQNGFAMIHEHMQASGEQRPTKGKILLAAVHGDIHDIGKNIVSMLLENYGYDIVDLGKDVPAQTVVTAAREHNSALIGLSALMTTTLKSMKETIAAARAAGLSCSFMVGGAVLNESYAKFVGADYYARDAIEGVAIANTFFADKTQSAKRLTSGRR